MRLAPINQAQPVNWSHPLAQGLVFAWMPRIALVRDLAKDRSGATMSTASIAMTGGPCDYMDSITTGVTNNRINFSYAATPEAKNLTISTFAYIPTTSEKGGFVMSGIQTNGTGIGCGNGGNWASAGNKLMVHIPYQRWFTSSTSMGTGWIHAAVTIEDDGTAYMYQNGDLVGTSPGGVASNPSAISIPGYANSEYTKPISDSFIYNRVLSLEEIRAIRQEALTGYPTLLNRLGSSLLLGPTTPTGGPFPWYLDQSAMSGGLQTLGL